MTLWLYIARRFLGALVSVFLGVVALALLFDSLELLRRAGGQGDIGFASVLSLAALRAPSFSMTAAPFAVLLAAMWTYARLARSSELVVARAAGVSAWGAVGPAVAAAAMVGVFSTSVYSPISAAMLDRFDRLEAQIFRDDARLVSVSSEGLWLRQGNYAAQSVIQARRSNADGTDLADVTILLFEGQDTFVGRIDAEKATLQPGYWRLETATIRRIDQTNPEAPPQRREREFYDMPTDLTAEQIVDSFAAPETIEFWRMPAFIRTLEEQGFSARRHLLHFHTLLAAPLIFGAMTLLGAAFSMRHARFGGLGLMALYATLTGFVVFFVLDITRALAGSGVIPPIPAAWGPPFASAMLAAGLLLHFEDG